METIQIVSSVVCLLLSCGNLGVLIYGFSKFLTKPRDTMEQKIAEIEIRLKEAELKLNKSNERYKEQDDTNEVLFSSLLALIEFEIQYLAMENKPINDDLKLAKNKLHSYLSKK